jgi:hypothetical protein
MQLPQVLQLVSRWVSTAAGVDGQCRLVGKDVHIVLWTKSTRWLLTLQIIPSLISLSCKQVWEVNTDTVRSSYIGRSYYSYSFSLALSVYNCTKHKKERVNNTNIKYKHNNLHKHKHTHTHTRVMCHTHYHSI